MTYRIFVESRVSKYVGWMVDGYEGKTWVREYPTYAEAEKVQNEFSKSNPNVTYIVVNLDDIAQELC